ncbi:MAG: hypothetical protein QOK13_1515, partial [Gaiellaceae bacterium]|nr:hypothetical protein [Gaiellaceae bacterium]
MPAAPPSALELDAFRAKADRFIAELDEEYYVHYAGLKEGFDLKSIYDRYPELTSLEQAQSMGLAVNGAGGGIRELWRFAVEGYMGELTREHTEREARLEAELKAKVGEQELPFRMLRPTIANEPDRAKRAEIEKTRNELTEEHLNPIHLESDEVVRDAVRKLGSDSYVDLYRRFGYDLDGLAEQCRAFLDSTERLYETTADRLFRERA